MYHKTLIRIRQFSVAAALLFSMIGSVRADNFHWIGVNGGGDGTTWNIGNNWSNITAGTSGTAPGTSDDVTFGNLAPDAAQTITLDDSHTVDSVYFTATGNRSYTINDDGGGEQLILRLWEGGLEGATQSLTVNSEVLYTTPGVIHYWANNAQLAINGGHDTTNGTGTVFFQAFNSSSIRLNSPWGMINGGNNPPLHFQGTFGSSSEYVLNSTYAVAEFEELNQNNVGANNTWSFADDSANGGMQISSATLSVRFDGRAGTAAGNRRTLTTTGVYVDGTIQFVADTTGSLVDGGLTLKVNPTAGTMSSAINFGTQSDAILELAPTAGTLTVNSTVTGAGKVVKSATGTGVVQAAWSHTGGTDIDNSTLRMNGGSMPDTGILKIAAVGIFDLNGNSETIGGLAGIGTVRGGGATLTVNEILSPGNSPGTLTLTNISLSLASSSDYLVEILNTGSFDSINLYGTMTIQAGSELSVTNLPGFSVALGDSFTIVNNDGSDLVTGTFAGLSHGTEFTTGPGGLGYQILYNTGVGGNDIVLIAVPEPSAVVLLSLGGLLLVRRRVT